MWQCSYTVISYWLTTIISKFSSIFAQIIYKIDLIVPSSLKVEQNIIYNAQDILLTLRSMQGCFWPLSSTTETFIRSPETAIVHENNTLVKTTTSVIIKIRCKMWYSYLCPLTEVITISTHPKHCHLFVLVLLCYMHSYIMINN